MIRYLPLLAVLGACVGAPPQPCVQCGDECVSTQSDVRHCGGCNQACASGQVCRSGACTATCGGGLTSCGSACADRQNDPKHCGSCNNACGVDEYCAAGMCTPIAPCGMGQTRCMSGCTNTQSDNLNCGTCGMACQAGLKCQAGMCVTSCLNGLTQCGGRCVDVSTDPTACGSCTKTCGSTERCVSGVCTDVFGIAPRTCVQLKQADGGYPATGQVAMFGRTEGPMLNVRCTPNGNTYLIVPQDGGMVNFARRAAGGFCTMGPEVVSRFSAVRMDYAVPNELVLFTDDFTFATSTGMQVQCNSNDPSTYTVNRMTYGTASACVSTNNPAGTANITLTGLPVALATSRWACGGFMVAGGVTISSFNQVANVTGGGLCGDCYPAEQLRLRACVNPTVETCDGRDSDCDGIVDDVLPDAGNAPDGGCQ